MFNIIYKFEGNEVVTGGFHTAADCRLRLEREGFDMSHPIDGRTVTDHSGTTATVEFDRQ